jgi:cytochrome c oxidase subunit 2
MWFEASKPGVYHLFCAEYCGTDHSGMTGRVVVMESVDYQTWLAGGADEYRTLADQGKQFFADHDCASCHAEGRRRRAPMLGGLFGTRVRLENGDTALFDETYIRESILDPNAKVSFGYEPLMPTYRGQLSEEQILALIEYIKSLGPAADGVSERRQP